MRIGTPNFVSRVAAIRYYAAYDKNPAASVTRMLAEGQIFIGEPKLKPGEYLGFTDDGLRYEISTRNLPHWLYAEQKRPTVPCAAWHIVPGGRCMNCGWRP